MTVIYNHSACTRHLSLAGNSLLCEGATALLQALALVCESSTAAFPPLARLSLQDNGIDCSGPQGMFGPVSFIRTLKRSTYYICCVSKYSGSIIYYGCDRNNIYFSVANLKISLFDEKLQ